MAKVVRREIRKRGFFGWVFLLLFFAFNAFMVLWAYHAVQAASLINAQTQAEAAGAVVGAGLAGGVIVFLWLAGAVILGLFAILTRGRKTVIEEVS